MSFVPDSFIKMLHEKGVVDDDVIDAMCLVNRGDFIEKSLASRSWEDQTLPIGKGQTISLPSIVGIMTQELEVKKSHKVLEIGTGCGYQTSILSHLCKMVYTVERYSSLAKFAADMFKKQRLYNIVPVIADGSIGLEKQAPFDRIMVTCSSYDIPKALIEQLKIGGIMIIPVGMDEKDQDLLKVIKTIKGIEVEKMLPTSFVPMLEGIGS